MAEALKLDETEEVATRSLTVVDQANAVNVIDSDSYTRAGFVWKSIKAMMAEVDEAFDKNIKRWHEGHKEALADKARYYQPLEQASRKVKQLMSTWSAEQERIRKIPKMAGGPVYREVWAAEVVDIKALCLAVATGKASTECVIGNMVSLNRQAVALKGTMNVPGVKAYSKRV